MQSVRYFDVNPEVKKTFYYCVVIVLEKLFVPILLFVKKMNRTTFSPRDMELTDGLP